MSRAYEEALADFIGPEPPRVRPTSTRTAMVLLGIFAALAAALLIVLTIR
jgi:hypothetical protein